MGRTDYSIIIPKHDFWSAPLPYMIWKAECAFKVHTAIDGASERRPGLQNNGQYQADAKGFAYPCKPE